MNLFCHVTKISILHKYVFTKLKKNILYISIENTTVRIIMIVSSSAQPETSEFRYVFALLCNLASIST